MNGRLYDPELGRMLSPDPYVQVPEYSQNFNRGSYVLNTPLNLTDPTGFSFLGKLFGGGAWDWLKQNWRTVLVIVVMAAITYLAFGTLTGVAGMWGATLLGSTAAAAAGGTVTAAVGGAFLGAVAGGLTAAVNGGNTSDVLRGAVVGGVSGALTAGMHSHTTRQIFPAAGV